MRARLWIAAVILPILAAVSVARAATIPFDLQGKAGNGLLSGNENHVINGTPGSGGEVGAGISYDDVANLLDIHIGWGSGNGFTNLSGNATGHHIHGPTANGGVAGFTQNASIRIGLDSLAGYNSSATSGGFNGTITLDATQEAELLAERYYLNVHTGTNGGGEIRGQMMVVPEPATGLTMIACVGAAMVTRRRIA
jgi:hypothetical protein